MKRINCGTRPEKVSNHWKLLLVYQSIQVHLQELLTVSFNHAQRSPNKLADLLANQGVNNVEGGIAYKWWEIPQNRLKALYEEQATEDKEMFHYWTWIASIN